MPSDDVTTMTIDPDEVQARAPRPFWLAMLLVLPYLVPYTLGQLAGLAFGGLRDGFRRGSR